MRKSLFLAITAVLVVFLFQALAAGATEKRALSIKAEARVQEVMKETGFSREKILNLVNLFAAAEKVQKSASNESDPKKKEILILEAEYYESLAKSYMFMDILEKKTKELIKELEKAKVTDTDNRISKKLATKINLLGAMGTKAVLVTTDTAARLLELKIKIWLASDSRMVEKAKELEEAYSGIETALDLFYKAIKPFGDLVLFEVMENFEY